MSSSRSQPGLEQYVWGIGLWDMGVVCSNPMLVMLAETSFFFNTNQNTVE